MCRPGYSYQGPSTYFDEYADEDVVRVNLFAIPDVYIQTKPPRTPAPTTTGKDASADKTTGAGKTVGTKEILPDWTFTYPYG